MRQECCSWGRCPRRGPGLRLQREQLQRWEIVFGNFHPPLREKDARSEKVAVCLLPMVLRLPCLYWCSAGDATLQVRKLVVRLWIWVDQRIDDYDSILRRKKNTKRRQTSQHVTPTNRIVGFPPLADFSGLIKTSRRVLCGRRCRRFYGCIAPSLSVRSDRVPEKRLFKTNRTRTRNNRCPSGPQVPATLGVKSAADGVHNRNILSRRHVMGISSTHPDHSAQNVRREYSS